jgi:hypothetical protein
MPFELKLEEVKASQKLGGAGKWDTKGERSGIVVVAQIEHSMGTSMLGGAIIVLVENKHVDFVRSKLHSQNEDWTRSQRVHRADKCSCSNYTNGQA